jgi:hypothetical protein
VFNQIKKVLSYKGKWIEYFVNELHIPLSMLSNMVRDVVKMADDYVDLSGKYVPLSKTCASCHEMSLALALRLTTKIVVIIIKII